MNIQYRENISIKLKKCLANEAYIFYSYLLGSNSSIIRSEDVDDQYVIMDMVGDFDIQKQREKTIRVSVHDLKVWEGRIVKSGCKIIQRFRDKERIPSRSITPTYLAIQDPYGYVWQLIDQHYLETMRGAAKPYDLIEAGLTVRVREICPPLRSIGVRSEEGFGLDGFVHDLISSADLGERSHVSVFQKYSSSVQGERFIFIPTDYNQDHVRGLSDIIQVIKDIGLKQAQMSRQGVLIAGVIGQGWSWRVVNQYTLSQSAADTEGRSADQRPVIVLSAKATMWLLNHPQMTDALRGELRALVRPYVGGRSWIDYVAIALCGVGSYAEGEEWVTQHLEFMRAHYGPTRSHYQWLKSNTQRALSASIGWYAMARSLNKPAQKPKSVRDQGGALVRIHVPLRFELRDAVQFYMALLDARAMQTSENTWLLSSDQWPKFEVTSEEIGFSSDRMKTTPIFGFLFEGASSLERQVKKALDLGAHLMSQLENTLYVSLRDPYGYLWSFNCQNKSGRPVGLIDESCTFGLRIDGVRRRLRSKKTSSILRLQGDIQAIKEILAFDLDRSRDADMRGVVIFSVDRFFVNIPICKVVGDQRPDMGHVIQALMSVAAAQYEAIKRGLSLGGGVGVGSGLWSHQEVESVALAQSIEVAQQLPSVPFVMMTRETFDDIAGRISQHERDIFHHIMGRIETGRETFYFLDYLFCVLDAKREDFFDVINCHNDFIDKKYRGSTTASSVMMNQYRQRYGVNMRGDSRLQGSLFIQMNQSFHKQPR